MEGHLDRVEQLSGLVAAVRNGHPERMDELLRESAGIVHALSRAHLGDSLAAEEAAADALVRVVNGLGKLEEPRAYVGWLGRIAARCAADAGRRRADAVAPSPEEPADTAGGPLDAARRSERATVIRRTVRDLPPKLRAPVLLHYVEGLSYRDIAAALGTSLSTVSRRVGRALATLKKHLGEEP